MAGTWRAGLVLALAGGLALGAPQAAGQVVDPATGEALDETRPVALVADSVEYDAEAGTLTATGDVEVFYGDRTLTAERIVYDQPAERIRAEGDIVLRDPTGTTLYADVAELDDELLDGLIAGARAVIGARAVDGATGRIAAVEARRVDGRYNTLSKAVYSPCDVCPESPTPLWRIRARRIIHDQEARVVHYENAYFDLFGVPVLWLPYFRHPDPTVDRASGFLVPDARNSGKYGFGVRVPYYWAIDPHTDVTFQPFATTDDGVVWDAELRRAFRAGDLFFRGSFAQTDFDGEPGLEGHVDTAATFRLPDLPGPAEWGWDANVTSDDAYLRFFDISDADRLTSEAFVRGYGRDFLYELSGVYFQSLRDDEPAGPIPRVLPDFRARKEFALPMAAGEIGVFADTQSLFRNVGTDVTRLSAGVDWERETVTPFGLGLRGFAMLRGDLFLTFEDPGAGDDDVLGRFVPLGGVEARYPLIYEERDGDAHVLEPIAQFVVTPFGLNDPQLPNEDSQQVEFDELSLFETNHFPGLDRVEEGPRFNLGLSYTRLAGDGLDFSAALGRTVRLAGGDEFEAGTGLDGTLSDWVASWRARFRDVASIGQRLRFDEDGVSRNEVFAAAAYGPARLSLGYVFLEETLIEEGPVPGTVPDTVEGREEVTALAGVTLTEAWGIEGFVQRDLAEDAFVEVGGAVTYANECCSVEVFVRRDFTDSEDTPAATSVGLQVRLLTLGTERDPRGVFGGAGPAGRFGRGGFDDDPEAGLTPGRER